MRAGDLHESVVFDRPAADLAGVQNGWNASVHACRAHFRYLRGSEAVMAARLAGRQPIVATIRRSTGARAITTDWRMRDLRSGIVYNVRTAIPSDDRHWIELTCESGVAV